MFDECEGLVYIVRQGDTLYKLSKIFHLSVSDIMRANPYVDVYNMQVGDELCIPIMTGKLPQVPQVPYMPSSPQVPSMPQMPLPQVPSMSSMPQNGLIPPNDFMPTIPTVPTVPLIPKTRIYVIQGTENISQLTEEFNVTYDDLLQYNPSISKDLTPGMVLIIPIYES